jgi:hypothetical protein
MTGYGATERLVIREYLSYIGVSKQGPAKELAVGHRTALAHAVIRPTLIVNDALSARIPVS